MERGEEEGGAGGEESPICVPRVLTRACTTRSEAKLREINCYATCTSAM